MSIEAATQQFLFCCHLPSCSAKVPFCRNHFSKFQQSDKESLADLVKVDCQLGLAWTLFPPFMKSTNCQNSFQMQQRTHLCSTRSSLTISCWPLYRHRVNAPKLYVGIWQLGQYLWCQVIPLLCLLTVLWPLQWPILLLLNYYCLAIV